MSKTLLRWSTCCLGLSCLLGAAAAWPAAAPADAAALRAELLDSAQRWSDKNRTDVARQMLAKLLAMEPDSPEGLAFMADMALRENKLDEARAILRTLQARQPLHPATRELQQLVEIYSTQREKLARMRLTDRAGRAAEAAAIAMELFPDGPPRYSALGPEIARITGQRVASLRGKAVPLARPPLVLRGAATGQARLAAPRPPGRKPVDGAPAGAVAAAGALPARRSLAANAAPNRTTRRTAAARPAPVSGPASPNPPAPTPEQSASALRAQADEQLQAQRLSPALRLLEEALVLTPDDAWLRYSLARLYLRLQLPAEARSVMDQGVVRTPADADMRYARALTLSALDEDEAALADLQQVTPEERSTGMRALEQRLNVKLLVAQAADPQRRDASLHRAEERAGNDTDLLRAVANAWFDNGQPGEATAVLQRRLQRTPAAPAAVQLSYVQLLNRARDDAQISALLPSLLARQDWSDAERAELLAVHVDQRERQIEQDVQTGKRVAALALAREPLPAQADADEAGVAAWRQQAQVRLLLAGGDYEAARALMQGMAPDTDLLLNAARQARRGGRYGEALGLFKQARQTELDTVAKGQAADAVALEKMDRDIAGIEERRKSWVEVGQLNIEKNSTEGLSSLRGWERPMVAWLPWAYDGKMFAHIDPVQLDAGSYAGGDPFAQPGAELMTRGVPQRADGVNLGVGYQGDELRWDIGEIGVGFAVRNWVGGLRRSGDIGATGYSVEASRRPLTGTLLSYAGTEDPINHAVWGGVVATGIGGRLARDFGPFSTSASASYALLTGQNVADNSRIQWRVAADRDVYKSSQQVVNVGLALSGLQHEKDLSGFTWGHGGYYSPNRNVTLSLPVDWSGRKGLFTWQLKASVSVSDSYSKASDFYPTNQAFQQQTGNPTYGSGGSSGSGWAYSGTAEYQVTPRLALGAQLAREVSDYYTPMNLLVYARFLLDPVREPLAQRPRPVQAYSQF